MKKILLLALAVLMLFALSGCSGEANKNVKTSDTETGIEMRYDLYSGENTKTVALKADAQISVSVTTTSGDFALRITDAAGNTAYTGSKMPTGSFVVTAIADGDYTIKTTAKSHAGGYRISWE